MRLDSIASITVLSGFLGAGKTSLLNHLLASSSGRRFGVLVNDFGELNIDARLVIGVHGETMELSNGCVCCTIREDLMVAVQQMLSRPDPPEHIVLETSGVSDPRAVIETLDRAEATGWVSLDGVVVVVDAEQYPLLSRRDRVLAVGQVKAADIIVLNKVDQVSEEAAQALAQKLRSRAPRARIVLAEHGRVPAALLLGSHPSEADMVAPANGLQDGHAHADTHDHDHDHAAAHDHVRDDAYWTFSWQSPRPLASSRLRRAIKDLPASVFRAKGLVQLAGRATRQAVLHVVGSRAELNLGEPWGDESPHTQIVLIGSGVAPTDASLAAAFATCEVAPGERPAPLQAVLRWLRGG